MLKDKGIGRTCAGARFGKEQIKILPSVFCHRDNFKPKFELISKYFSVKILYVRDV
jgi:hypothetical protein